MAVFTKTFNLLRLFRYFTNKQMFCLVWFDVFYLFIARCQNKRSYGMFSLGLAIKVRLYRFIKKSKSDLFKKNINVLLILLCGCLYQKIQHLYSKGGMGLHFLYDFFFFIANYYCEAIKIKVVCGGVCVNINMYNIHISRFYLLLFVEKYRRNYSTPTPLSGASWLWRSVVIAAVYNYCFTDHAFLPDFSRLHLLLLSTTVSFRFPRYLALCFQQPLLIIIFLSFLVLITPMVVNVFWYSAPRCFCANIAPHQRYWGKPLRDDSTFVFC